MTLEASGLRMMITYEFCRRFRIYMSGHVRLQELEPTVEGRRWKHVRIQVRSGRLSERMVGRKCFVCARRTKKKQKKDEKKKRKVSQVGSEKDEQGSDDGHDDDKHDSSGDQFGRKGGKSGLAAECTDAVDSVGYVRVTKLESVSEKGKQIAFSALMRASSKDVRAELDSRTVTCVGDADCVVLSLTGETATVCTFWKEREPFESIPSGTVALGSINPATGTRFVLEWHKALFLSNRLSQIRRCRKQGRAKEIAVAVNDAPRQVNKASVTRDGWQFEISVELAGVISCIPGCVQPTDEDLVHYLRIEVTCAPEWTLYDKKFATTEEALAEKARVVEVVDAERTESPSVTSVDSEDDDSVDEGLGRRGPKIPTPSELEDALLCAERVIATVNVAQQEDEIDDDGVSGRADRTVNPMSGDEWKMWSLPSQEKKSVITCEVLARRWGIGLAAAHRTLCRTTQQSMQAFMPPGYRRLSTAQPHLIYRQLRTRWYSDAVLVLAKVESSICRKTCAQFYLDGEGYDLFYPRQSKAFASDVIQDIDGMPKNFVTDGAREELGKDGAAEMKHRRIVQTEPCSTLQNRAEEKGEEGD